MTAIDRLGSVLLHFLWQGLVIAAVFAALRAAARRCSPNVRYLLACAALAAIFCAPVITWLVLSPAPPNPVSLSAAARWYAAAAQSQPAKPNVIEWVTPAPVPYLTWVVAVWLSGATVFSIRLLGISIFALRLRRRIHPAPPETQRTLDRLAARIRLSRPVRLLIAATDVPSVVGWLRPVVLIPASALAGLPPEHLEALLLHELAHIRRHDCLVNFVQSIAEALLFYHPAVWWISAQLRVEREHCCDDIAVSATGDVLTYARALADLECARRSLPAPALSAAGGSLSARIARLLGVPRAVSRPAPAGVLGSAAAIVLAAAAVFAQSGAPARFEVVSVKPSTEQRMRYVRPMPGGRLVASAPVRMLILNAYRVQSFEVVGGPSWVDSDRYQIEARAEGNPDRDQLLRMLQPLLADRFQLKVHRETREMPVYELVAGRRRPALAPPKDDTCAAPGPNTPSDWSGGRIEPPTAGRGPLPPCGDLRVSLEPSGVRVQGGKVGIAELAKTLAMVMGRPVVDKTGLTGLYDLQLGFSADASTPELPPPPPGAPDSNLPSIITALQEQLGLKLEAAKQPVDVLVIDHIARPTAN